MSDAALEDLSDLTDEQRQVLVRIVEAFRRTRQSAEESQAFVGFWDKLRRTRSPMTDEEAETIATEAVAFARGRL